MRNYRGKDDSMKRFFIPFIPIKKRHRCNFKTGHAYNHPDNVKTERDIAAFYKKQCGYFFDNDVPVHITVIARKPAKTYAQEGTPWITKPDADNILKSVMDAPIGVAYKDDNQVCSPFCLKIYGERGSKPQTTVYIAPFKDMEVKLCLKNTHRGQQSQMQTTF